MGYEKRPVVARLEACKDPDDALMIHEGSAAYTWSGKRVSYEAFCEITKNNKERYEYIDGEIYLLPSPGVSHQLFLANLYTLFNNWFKGKPCRVFFSPFDVTLANHALKSKNVVEPVYLSPVII